MVSDESPKSDGVAGVVAISDLNEERRDCGVLRRAAHEGWDVPAEDRPHIVSRMVGIVKRQTVTVATMMGPCESESVADGNAIQAARVILAMTGQQQADRHHADKLAQDDKHLAVSWADTLAKVPPDELIAAAIRLGMVDKLPPALREQARKRMEGK